MLFHAGNPTGPDLGSYVGSILASKDVMAKVKVVYANLEEVIERTEGFLAQLNADLRSITSVAYLTSHKFLENFQAVKSQIFDTRRSLRRLAIR